MSVHCSAMYDNGAAGWKIAVLGYSRLRINDLLRLETVITRS